MTRDHATAQEAHSDNPHSRQTLWQHVCWPSRVHSAGSRGPASTASAISISGLCRMVGRRLQCRWGSLWLLVYLLSSSGFTQKSQMLYMTCHRCSLCSLWMKQSKAPRGAVEGFTYYLEPEEGRPPPAPLPSDPRGSSSPGTGRQGGVAVTDDCGGTNLTMCPLYKPIQSDPVPFKVSSHRQKPASLQLRSDTCTPVGLG